jgi:hypothetical protein
MDRALVFVAVMGLLPPSCAKMLGGSPDSPPQTDPPPVIPSSAPTTPPTYQQPEPVGLPPPTSAPPPGQSPEYVKAKEAAEKKDYKKVKAILGPRMKNSRTTNEEAQLLMEACTSLKDKACMEMVRKAHPEIGS